jgi:hypothetical protein
MTPMVNRTQGLVLAFFGVVWAALIVIVAFAPDVYDTTLKVPNGGRAVELGFVVALSLFIGLLALGVARKWRWVFWLILLAFLAGPLRVVASALELGGVIPAQGPAWYTVVQGIIGVAQLLIAVAMIAGYRKRGVWGAY